LANELYSVLEEINIGTRFKNNFFVSELTTFFTSFTGISETLSS